MNKQSPFSYFSCYCFRNGRNAFMNKTRWWTGFIIFSMVLFVFNAVALAFNDTQESRETLRGVTPIYVVIDDITPALEQNGVSADRLKADVERQLKKAGITVITAVQHKDSAESSPAGLYVRINALKSNMLKSGFDIDYYAISISIELIQRCLPLTKKNIDPTYIASRAASACTWSTNNIYLAGEERLIDIRDCVKELVDHFIKAYVSVNPKREGRLKH